VFQLVFDVTTGYSDLAMAQSDSISSALASPTSYADRILSSDDMFSYSLYMAKTYKTFNFRDKNDLDASTVVGKGTIFGYCYSTDPDAYVYFREYDKCRYVYSDGTTSLIASCFVLIDPIIPIDPLPILPILP
jgi:hypothetical protein